jgi:hypothetical protein
MENIKIYFKKHKQGLFLAVLVAYIIILGIGFIAELFQIQWILDLPIYKL